MEIEVNWMWKVRTKIVPIIIGAIGTINTFTAIVDLS